MRQINEIGVEDQRVILKHLLTKSGYTQKKRPGQGKIMTLSTSIKLDFPVILKRELKKRNGKIKISLFETDNVIGIKQFKDHNNFLLETTSTIEEITFLR